jgi:single-strand DNA-binding protein
MKDINKVILIGRLGADPVRRETKTGWTVVHFSLATSRKIVREVAVAADAEMLAGEVPASPTIEAGASEETQWHRVVVWGKQGEACAQYLKKGQTVYVEGSIRSRKYDAQDGTNRVAFEVHAETVSFLGRSVSASVPNVAPARIKKRVKTTASGQQEFDVAS